MTDVHDTVERHYTHIARIYDRLWAGYTERALAPVLDMLALRGTERILDVAAGTGELEQRIVARHPQQPIHGVDITDAMIARARTKLRAFPTLEFSKADGRELPFPSAQFDIVVSCSAFHYMREPQRVITEMARVLRPGGRVIIMDWCRDFVRGKFYNWWRRRVIPAHHQVHTRAELSQLMRTAGLTPTRQRTFSIFGFWSMMCVEGLRTPSS